MFVKTNGCQNKSKLGHAIGNCFVKNGCAHVKLKEISLQAPMVSVSFLSDINDNIVFRIWPQERKGTV